MKHRVEYEIRWPSADEWARAWADFIRESLAALPQSPAPGAVIHEDGSSRVTLLEGVLSQPGSVYRAEAAEPMMAGTIRIGRDHQVAMDLADDAGDVRARGSLNSLENPHVAEGAFKAPNVEVTGRFDHLDRDFLDVRAGLPWIEAQVSTRIDDRPGDADRLVIEIEAHGRGVWRPVVSTMLTIVQPLVRRGADEVAKGIAQWCAEMPAYGFDGRPRLEPKEHIAPLKVGMERLREDFHRVEEQLSLRPFWSRGGKAWRHAYADLPSISLPDDDVLPTDVLGRRQTWADVQSRLVDRVLRRSRFVRRRCIDAEVEMATAEMIATIQMDQESFERDAEPDTRRFRFRPGTEPLDTSWLATPWTTLSKITGATDEKSAMRDLRALAEDAG